MSHNSIPTIATLLVGYSSNAFNLNLTLTLVLTLTLIPALTIDFPMGQSHCNVRTLLCNIIRIHIPETYIVVSRHTSSALPNNVQIQHCHEDFLYTQNNNSTTVYIADETSSMPIAQQTDPQRRECLKTAHHRTSPHITAHHRTSTAH